VLPSYQTYSIAEEEAGFPDTAVSYQEKLEKVVAKILRLGFNFKRDV
jgi:hypothetical protein